jgi:hydroxymethylpyrimidine pyrophosphatase-like HAD family hydrolase
MGDAENDAEMLAVSGVSVAMGNACEASKTAARYLTDDCDRDGVYNAVMRFFR